MFSKCLRTLIRTGKLVILYQKWTSTMCSHDCRIWRHPTLCRLWKWAVPLCFWPSPSAVSSSVLSFRPAVLSLSFHALTAWRLQQADTSWPVTQHVTDSVCSQLWPRFITSYVLYGFILHTEESHCSHTVAVACDYFLRVGSGPGHLTLYVKCIYITCFTASSSLTP